MSPESGVLEVRGQGPAGVRLPSLALRAHLCPVSLTGQSPADCHGCHNWQMGAFTYPPVGWFRARKTFSPKDKNLQDICPENCYRFKTYGHVHTCPQCQETGDISWDIRPDQDILQVGTSLPDPTAKPVNNQCIVDHGMTPFILYCSFAPILCIDLNCEVFTIIE